MNRMLISSTLVDEVRVALVKDGFLYDLDIEQRGVEQKKANIYKGIISRIEPSLEAAFVNFGKAKQGFLPFKAVARSYVRPELAGESFSKLGIKDVFTEGQEVLVQVEKEERGNKGAALTTFISLAGSYLVLMPNNPRVGGVSRRVDDKERDELRDLLHNLNVPEGMGLIVRTAGVGRSEEELKWDLESLLNRWQAIQEAWQKVAAPALIYQEGDAVMRAIRDYLRKDIDEILVDNPALFEEAKRYVEEAKPNFANKVKLYTGNASLFSHYQVEHQIETGYYREVKLPSGGSISIDHTEALISIDVNSAKATGGSDIEETAFNTNLEAADEIARQLRIRDIGGLIVIDFIDMAKIKNQQEVSNRLRNALAYDRARVQVGNITRFGLLEMSRQRLGSHLGETVQVTCPRCEGQGTVRSIESLSTSILRLVEEEGLKKDTAEVQVQLPLDLATFVLNERRKVIEDITQRLKINIIILPNPQLETPKYKLKRMTIHEIPSTRLSSYQLMEMTDPKMPVQQKNKGNVTTDKPAVPNSLAGRKVQPRSLWAKIGQLFAGWFRHSEGTQQSKERRTSGRNGVRNSNRNGKNNHFVAGGQRGNRARGNGEARNRRYKSRGGNVGKADSGIEINKVVSNGSLGVKATKPAAPVVMAPPVVVSPTSSSTTEQN